MGVWVREAAVADLIHPRVLQGEGGQCPNRLEPGDLKKEMHSEPWDDGVEINSQTQHSQSDEYQKHKENPKAARARKGLRVALPATQKEECRHCMTENGGLAL